MRRFLLFLARHRYAAENLYIVWLGLAITVAAVAFVFDPNFAAQSAIGQYVHPWDWIWYTGWFFGGIFLTVGILFARVDIEIVGHMLFAASITVYVVTIVLVTGITPGVITLPALVVASVVRTLVLAFVASELTRIREERKP